MSKWLYDRFFSEHEGYPNGIALEDFEVPNSIYFQGKKEKPCVEISNNAIKLSHFIGIDWLNLESKLAIYIEPKLNKEGAKTDYLKMLFSALRHPEIGTYTSDLFEIKFDLPSIEINHENDLITPFLIVEYLQILKRIVTKGLIKRYYKAEDNLTNKVKGKILVSKSIKENLIKNKPLKTFCSYEEFGINCNENKILKKALNFSKAYLQKFNHFKNINYTNQILGFVSPAFYGVDEDVKIQDVINLNTGSFFKDYKRAMELSICILRHFGFNISNTQNRILKVHPFWIDMSKLFELYVLGLLKNEYDNDVTYHFRSFWNELDFLINTENLKMVVDAKYKPYNNKKISTDDVRQVSGYSRLTSVYKSLGKDPNSIVDCLFIYPDQNLGLKEFKNVNLLDPNRLISGFERIFKIGVQIPIVASENN